MENGGERGNCNFSGTSEHQVAVADSKFGCCLGCLHAAKEFQSHATGVFLEVARLAGLRLCV